MSQPLAAPLSYSNMLISHVWKNTDMMISVHVNDANDEKKNENRKDGEDL